MLRARWSRSECIIKFPYIIADAWKVEDLKIEHNQCLKLVILVVVYVLYNTIVMDYQIS